MPTPTDYRMSFMKHLEEFRKRLVRSLIAIGVGFGLSWNFVDRIQNFLVKPLMDQLPQGQQHLSALKVTDPFIIQIKIAFYAGLFITSPVVLYQLWSFIAPALYDKERKYIGRISFASFVLFIGGLAFGYYAFLPLCFKFFVAFIKGYIVQTYTLAEYISFTVRSVMAFGLVFQTPLLLLILNYMGLVNAPFLKKFRKYALLLAFIIGAVLTPTPDAMNQTLMSVPIYLFYEISIWVIVLFGRKKKPAQEAAQSEEAAPGGGSASPAG